MVSIVDVARGVVRFLKRLDHTYAATQYYRKCGRLGEWCGPVGTMRVTLRVYMWNMPWLQDVALGVHPGRSVCLFVFEHVPPTTYVV